MQEIIKSDEKIIKLNVSKKDAIAYYFKIDEVEKARNIQNISNPVISLYQLKNHYNYFYTDMPYSTSSLKEYDITYLGNNRFVLSFPVINPNEDISIPSYTHYPLNMIAFDKYK